MLKGLFPTWTQVSQSTTSPLIFGYQPIWNPSFSTRLMAFYISAMPLLVLKSCQHLCLHHSFWPFNANIHHSQVPTKVTNPGQICNIVLFSMYLNKWSHDLSLTCKFLSLKSLVQTYKLTTITTVQPLLFQIYWFLF